MVWFATGEKAAPDSAFLYNFEIYERYRRQGYGMQALQALEEKVRELGVSKILLHVFGHNLAARNLYEKMGYEITGIHMAKNVS